MKTLPPYIHKTTSNAERKMFAIIKESPDLDSWYCLHSLGLSQHLYKREGEIDVLLIGPAGIFVIEVKGGRVQREQGVWKFTDRYGHVSEKRESPFNQARSAMYSLRADISQQFSGAINQHLFGYGVAFPDIQFNTESPEWDLDMVFDTRDTKFAFSEYLDRLVASWKKRQRNAKRLTRKEVDGIVKYLRGDFETVRPINAIVSETEEEIIRLTDEQLTCLDAMAGNDRVMFVGAAGTGKTLIAVEKARRNESMGIRTIFLCFNKFLAAYLSKVLNKDARLEYVQVKTVHAFIYEIIVKAGYEQELNDASRKYDDNTLYSQIYPELFRKAWNQKDVYDELIIDEAQDVLSDVYIKLLDTLIAGGFETGVWNIFLDPENQKNMFINLQKETLNYLKHNSVTYNLSVNCRNTKPIAIQTEVVTGIATASVRNLEGIPVRYLWYQNEGDQALKVSDAINKLLQDGVLPDDITVLSPKRYGSSISGSGRLRIIKPMFHLDTENISNGRGDKIAYTSIQSYKGLESPVIVVTDIDELERKWNQVVNYVGFTRARSILIVAMQIGLKAEYSKKIRQM